MCVGLGSNGLECACMHSFAMRSRTGPGRQRRGSHREAPETHPHPVHTHPKPPASSFPGSHAWGIGAWAHNPCTLRFGQNLGISPSADADQAIGHGK